MQYFWSLNVRALASDFLKIFHFTILKATLSMRSRLIVISKVSHKKPIGLPSHTTPPTTKMRKKKLQLGIGSKGFIYIYIYISLFNLRKQRFKIAHRSSKVLCLVNIIDFLWNRSWSQILAFFSFSFSFSFSFFLIFFII